MTSSGSTGRVILIAGPTASGKSTAALALAEKIDAEIVNADAIQVYRDLAILSARPTMADMQVARHHLYGHVDAAHGYSAGAWSREAAPLVAEIIGRGKAAIIVGGTGLFFRAVEHGLAPTPAIPSAVRAAALARLEEIGLAAFRREAIAFDPEAAGLEPADRQRHVRVWEVGMATGEALSALQQRPTTSAFPLAVLRLVIEPPRAALYEAIEARFDKMLARGALEEARRLAERALAANLPAMKAVGAAELMAHLRNELLLADAIELAKRNSRRFAKRQLTWFRHQALDWRRAANTQEALALAAAV